MIIESNFQDAAAAPLQKLCLADPNNICHYSNWEFDFRQIDPGPTETKVFVRSSPHVSLAEFNLDRAFHQRGCSPTDTVTLGLPSVGLKSWRGIEIVTPGMVNFGTGIEFDGVSGPDFVGLSVSISKPSLERVSTQMGLSLPADFLRRTVLPVCRNTRALYRLRDNAHALLHRQGAPFGDLQQEDLVAELISAASDAEEFDDRSAFSMRAKSVTRAVDIMKDRLNDGVSIGQLCADSGASLRTLTRGFQERFGIGPKAYFNRLRLGRVRSALLHGSITCSVADTANEWGFWHMGQFAKDYHRMFGELPSETLNGTK